MKSKYLQKYTWSILHNWITEVYLKYSSILTGQNTNGSLHSLWSNGLIYRAQVYQTKDLRFKTIGWQKSCHSLSSLKSQSNEYLGFLGAWWLKVSPPCNSAAYRQLNTINKVVHWEKWALKWGNHLFVNYTEV